MNVPSGLRLQGHSVSVTPDKTMNRQDGTFGLAGSPGSI